MTAQTEQERAEFEKAWRERPIYMGGVHQKEVAYIWWMQAARRAPAVPVPQGWKLVPQRLTQDMADAAKCVDGRLSVWKYDDAYRAMLAAAPQPPESALVPSIAVTPEMVEAANEAYCPFGDMELALCAALQVAPIPPGAAPVQLPENIREGEPYDNPAFEALARALGVWGTAQSAACAQFWIAAKEQST